MMTAHRRGDDESRQKAEDTAHVLLANSDLPLLIRCRACMVLGKFGSKGCRKSRESLQDNG